MTAENLDRMRDLASRQHGLLRVEQIRDLGIGRGRMRNEVEHGRLIERSARLLEVAGAPHTTEWEAMCVVLDTPRAASLSHMSAAAWWGLPGRPLQPWNVTRNRGIRGERSTDVVAHEPRSLLASHVTTLRDLPVTTPARTVFDLAATASPDATESALDAFWTRGLVNIHQLRRMMKDIGGRGRAGTVLMRGLIEDRSDETFLPTESGLELRFAKLMKNAAMKPLARQVPLGDDRGWIGRFDFVDQQRRIVVEVQSQQYHSALSDRRRDERRREVLQMDGWIVVEAWDSDLWHNPETVLAKIRQARVTATQPRPSTNSHWWKAG